MSETELNLIQEFRTLSDYVRLLGKHILQTQIRLERIEKNIDEIYLNQRKYVMETKVELTKIKEQIVNQSEFSNFIEQFKNSTLKPFPSLHISVPVCTALMKIPQKESMLMHLPEFTSEVLRKEELPLQETRKNEEETEKIEKQKEESKKRRFPFLRW